MRYRLPFAAAVLAISLLAPAASAMRHASDTAVCPPGTSDPNYCVGPPAIDGHPMTGQANGTATARVSTSAPGDLLVAFVRSDSPYTIGNASTVYGGRLKWSRVAGVNGALGDAEVWVARATSRLKCVKITASAVNFPERFDEVLTVIAFTNATGIGASGTFFSKSGAPTGSLRTTQPNSWVFAAGDDWLASKARTAGPGQTIQQQSSDAVGDTYWVQSTSAPTPVAGTKVTINDIAPTTDPYNLVLVEIL
jgi:hypothetical protein